MAAATTVQQRGVDGDRCKRRDAMLHSRGRILTTHAGSLPRTQELIELLVQQSQGEAVDAATMAAEELVWEKLRALRDGAAIASRRLFGTAVATS
jgi:hypothetical protein